MSSNQPVALIMGASRGIGRQVAIDLSKNGYTGTKHTQQTKHTLLNTTKKLILKK